MNEDIAFREWCREKYHEYQKTAPQMAESFKKLGDLMKEVIIEDLGLEWRLENPKLKTSN